MLGSPLRHGIDWMTTITHTIRRVVFFDPQHPDQDTQEVILENVQPDDGQNVTEMTTTIASPVGIDSLTQELTTSIPLEDILLNAFSPEEEGFEPVAAFIKDDTLLIEPQSDSSLLPAIVEENSQSTEDVATLPNLPPVVTSRTPRSKAMLQIAVGTIGISAILIAIVLISSFKKDYSTTFMVSRGVQTV